MQEKLENYFAAIFFHFLFHGFLQHDFQALAFMLMYSSTVYKLDSKNLSNSVALVHLIP